MAADGWTRRLDDRADALLKRRFGWGLFTEPRQSLRKQLVRNIGAAVAVALFLLVLLLVTGQSSQAPLLIGPLVGVVIGTFIGAGLQRRHRAAGSREKSSSA